MRPYLRILKRVARIFDALTVLKVPYTAKMRLCPSADETIRIARTVEKGGASLITVHGRTARQGSSSIPPDLAAMKKVKQAVLIPVIGNGGIARPRGCGSDD